MKKLHVSLSVLLLTPSQTTNLKLSSANSFNLDQSKICRLGKSYTEQTDLHGHGIVDEKTSCFYISTFAYPFPNDKI